MANQVSKNNPASRSTFNSFAVMDAIKRENSINVWVFNTASEVRGGSKSNIEFTVPTSNNESAYVRIPSTWVPINIGSQAPKDALFVCTNFLNSVNKGILRPITNQDAEKFFATTEGAIEAYDITVNRMSSLNNATDDFELQAPFDLATIDEADMVPEGITPLVVSVIARLNDEQPDITEIEAYNSLKTIESSLEPKDLEYIVKHTKSVRLQSYANKLRSK